MFFCFKRGMIPYFKSGSNKTKLGGTAETSVPSGMEVFYFGRKEEGSMLGLESGSIALAYVLSVSSSALCIAYGMYNWKKDQ